MLSNEIRKALLEIIDTLRKQRELYANMVHARVKLELKKLKIERELINREAEIMLAICNAKDENGKPLFPNETLRKAEITVRTASDKSMVKGIKLVDRCKHRINKQRLGEEIVLAHIKNMTSLEKLYLIEMETAL